VQLISQLVKKGKIKEGRIEASYQRIMRYKIALGLVAHSK
jgi:beta-glucosidase-like glycosyl hydrolase